jgi:glutaredoxin-related protein
MLNKQDMKINYSSNNITPFGGVCFIDEILSSTGVSNLIDQQLGQRGSLATYSFSDVIKSRWLVALSGGECAEDVKENLKSILSPVKHTKIPSPDTILGAEKSLATPKMEYISKTGVQHEFNINMPLNDLMVKTLIRLKTINTKDDDYTMDYDNQFIPAGKFDAKRSYKQKDGYFPGIATINNNPVYIENRNGNSGVKFKQEETLERLYSLLSNNEIKVKRSRMDCGSFGKAILKVIAQNSELYYVRAQRCDDLREQIKQVTDWQTTRIGYKNYQVASIEYAPFSEDKTYRYVISRERKKDGQGNLFTQDDFKYRAILTNDRTKTDLEVIEFYNQRGDSERVFDEMNNDFNWKNLPYSFMNENTVYMIIMAICRNIYQYLIKLISSKVDFIKPTDRLKKFIYRFMSVPAKWITRGGQKILKLFTSKPYHLVLE